MFVLNTPKTRIPNKTDNPLIIFKEFPDGSASGKKRKF